MVGLLITLLSDFGTKDPYVAEMKGVILRICPQARLVDITHDVKKFNVRDGAYLLARASSYFPDGTIHVAVVDPGVGWSRKPIIIETASAYFVGPDNGLLALAAAKHGAMKAYEVIPKETTKRVAPTFHGRDIFAPTAAHLALGVSPTHLGREVKTWVKPDFATPRFLDKNIVEGVVLYIDSFGNIVTNITRDDFKALGGDLGDELRVEVMGDGVAEMVFHITYSEVSEGEFVALMGSGGFLEISINLGDASGTLKAVEGAKLRIMRKG